jgi:hypothetical protein
MVSTRYDTDDTAIRVEGTKGYNQVDLTENTRLTLPVYCMREHEKKTPGV